MAVCGLYLLYPAKKGTQPPDAYQAYEFNAHYDGKAWYARGNDGGIYRYFDGNDGTVHWSGSLIDPVSPLKVPDHVYEIFNIRVKGK